jgi:hypothetical protein
MNQELIERHDLLRGKMTLCELRIQRLRARVDLEQRRWAVLLAKLARVQRRMDDEKRE